MVRDHATTPPSPSDLYVWLGNFVDEVQRVRPHVSLKLANGRQEYAPTPDPKEAAAAYHARQKPELPAAPAARFYPVDGDYFVLRYS